MNKMMTYLAISSISLNVIVLIIMAWLVLKHKRLNHNINDIAASASEGQLPYIINKSHNDIVKINEEIDQLNQYYGKLYRLTDNTLQNIGLIRYDAFREMGGNLSFSLALLNNQNDGFILSSINGRNDHRLYVKNIRAGVSNDHQLTEEEVKALEDAQKSARAVTKNLANTKLVKEIKKKEKIATDPS